MLNDFLKRYQQKNRPESKITVPLTLKEVLQGGSKQLTFDKHNICQTCKGTGKEHVEQCPVCNGMGMSVHREQRGNAIYEAITPCYHCKGLGYITSGSSCPNCHGLGFHNEPQNFTIEIPVGVPFGIAIRIPGRGHNNGDLYAMFVPNGSDQYERMGDDILGSLELTYPELLLGVEKVIDTIDGTVKLQINKLSKPNERIRLKNLGLPNYHHHGRGDLFLVLKLKDVKELTEQEEQILQSLMNEKNFKS